MVSLTLKHRFSTKRRFCVYTNSPTSRCDLRVVETAIGLISSLGTYKKVNFLRLMLRVGMRSLTCREDL